VEYTFETFRLVPSQRLLVEGARRIELGSRAFDLLVCLVERREQVVTNAQLLTAVWSDTVVDVGSLRVHMSGLRRALGEGRGGSRYIVNVPLKGYSFVAPVQELHAGRIEEPAPDAIPSPDWAEPSSAHDSFPPLLTRVIGRDGIVATLAASLPARRCVSIVGAGGIGKTTVATVLARGLAAAHGYPVVFVPLALAADPSQALHALASAVDVPGGEPITVPSILHAVRHKRMLLILDNCEHVIGLAAEIAEQLLRSAPMMHLLATSREPLRIEGEWVHRLESLEVPESTTPLSASDALSYPSVALFVERAMSESDAFQLGDDNASLVGEICRRLDGIPLAIELAAASVSLLGLRELRDRLSSRLSLLKRGRRTALPRHQTLQATLDWSHELLSPLERSVLRRLSAFTGPFTLDAAIEVVGGSSSQEQFLSVADAISELASKSLLVADVTCDPVEYRLLETTRAYGLERLQEADESEEIARRHAQYFDTLAARRPPETEPAALVSWIMTNVRHMADFRAAIEWGFSTGHHDLGIRITSNGAPLWFELSRMGEFRSLGERAWNAIRSGAQVGEHAEMMLCEALGHALWNTQAEPEEMRRAFDRSLELAQRLGSKELQRRSLWGLWLICNADGTYESSQTLARRFGDTVAASRHRKLDLTYVRMMALGSHLKGQQGKALVYGRHLLDYPVAVNHTAQKSGFQFDQRVAALTVLARSLWVYGLPEQAMGHARAAVDEGLRLGHSLSLCYALAMSAVPVAMWAGEFGEAERFNALLLRHSTEHALHFWRNFGVFYPLALGPARSSLAMMAGHVDLQSQRPTMLLRETLATLNPELVDHVTLRRAERGVPSWCLPELMRILIVRRSKGRPLSSESERVLRAALDIASRQQALAWQLRCGLTLAEGLSALGRKHESREILEPILRRVTEGLRSAEVSEAQAILDAS